MDFSLYPEDIPFVFFYIIFLKCLEVEKKGNIYLLSSLSVKNPVNNSVVCQLFSVSESLVWIVESIRSKSKDPGICGFYV